MKEMTDAELRALAKALDASTRADQSRLALARRELMRRKRAAKKMAACSP